MAQGLFGFSPLGLVVGVLQQAASDARQPVQYIDRLGCGPGKYSAGRPPRCVDIPGYQAPQAPYQPEPIGLPDPVFGPVPAEPGAPEPPQSPPEPISTGVPFPLSPTPVPSQPAPAPTPEPPLRPVPPGLPAPANDPVFRPTAANDPVFGQQGIQKVPARSVLGKLARFLTGPIGWLLEGITYTGGVGPHGRGELPRNTPLRKPRAATDRPASGIHGPAGNPAALPTLPEVVVTGQRPKPQPRGNRNPRPVPYPSIPSVIGGPVIAPRPAARPSAPAGRPAARVKPAPKPGAKPAPLFKFSVDPLTILKLLPRRSPRYALQPLPKSPPAPRYPVEQPYASPLEQPFFEPVGFPKPAPTTNPFAPSDFPPKSTPTGSKKPDPLTPLNPGVLTLPQLGPVPKEDLDRCVDRCKKRASKPRKKRPPRTVCYQGTYSQLSRGISYHRGKEIPCR